MLGIADARPYMFMFSASAQAKNRELISLHLQGILLIIVCRIIVSTYIYYSYHCHGIDKCPKIF